MSDVLIPTVRNVRDVGKRTTDSQIYVGRRTKWGNPWKIGESGTREQVIELFEQYIHDVLEKQPEFLDELRGKDLVCWCAPLACHADILLKLANA